MTIKKIIFFTLAIVLLASCSKENTDTYERFYFRTSDGADLAVQVDGNRNSNTFILLLHGGPGGSGFEYNTGVYSERLESKYAMVYLDQRGQGASQGNYSEVTLQRFADDVYELTLFLKERYGQDISIFVMGHSWGGTTGTYAMLNTNIQNEIKGWIEANGAHDIPFINREAIKMFLDIGRAEIADGNAVDVWQEIVDFAESIDTNNITDEEGGRINGYGFTAESLILGVPEGGGTASHGLATSPIFSLTSFWANNITSSAILDETEAAAMTNELYKINIPTLLLWGKYDFVVPPALGESAYANIGTSDKKLVVFENSGHSPMDAEAILFADEVEEFVELYK